MRRTKGRESGQNLLLEPAASSGWTFWFSLSTGPEINRKDGEEFQIR
jgi:hypothetical protein